MLIAVFLRWLHQLPPTPTKSNTPFFSSQLNYLLSSTTPHSAIFVAGDETQQVPWFFRAPGSQIRPLDTALPGGAQSQSVNTLRPQAGKYLTETGPLTTVRN